MLITQSSNFGLPCTTVSNIEVLDIILSGKKLTIVTIGPNAKIITIGRKKYHLIIKNLKPILIAKKEGQKGLKMELAFHSSAKL